MCRYCKVELYLKTVQYTKPLTQPLTEVGVLRDKLLDLTGEIYVKVPNKYCSMCGLELKEIKE